MSPALPGAMFRASRSSMIMPPSQSSCTRSPALGPNARENADRTSLARSRPPALSANRARTGLAS